MNKIFFHNKIFFSFSFVIVAFWNKKNQSFEVDLSINEKLNKKLLLSKLKSDMKDENEVKNLWDNELLSLIFFISSTSTLFFLSFLFSNVALKIRRIWVNENLWFFLQWLHLSRSIDLSVKGRSFSKVMQSVLFNNYICVVSGFYEKRFF